MLFTSFEFLLFLPVVLFTYFLLPVNKRWLWLLIASYFFYAYNHPAYLFILFLSTSIDFLVGHRIFNASTNKYKKKWLFVSIFSNLTILLFFKYFNFFSEEITVFINYFNIIYELPQHNFLLPLGISFYTFQTLSYSIDIYRGYLKPTTHFGRFALYVCFFPQLVAGPIERARNLLSQFHFNYQFDYIRIIQGLRLILWGFFKKLVLADNLALYVNEVYNISNGHHGLSIIIATFFFLLQVFYDFSAYSDIAIGIARIMGVQLSKNFSNHIYFVSPAHYWREWHITLTNWFRDYLFFPLTRLNKKKWFWYTSLFLTFLITGLWHGAAWTFIIWGILQGFYLVIDHLTLQKRKFLYNRIGLMEYPKLMIVINIFFTMQLTLLSIVFFRATSVEESFFLLSKAFDWSNPYIDIRIGKINQLFLLVMVILTDILNFQLGDSTIFEWLEKQKKEFRWGFYFIVINLILYARAPEQIKFIYFEF